MGIVQVAKLQLFTHYSTYSEKILYFLTIAVRGKPCPQNAFYVSHGFFRQKNIRTYFSHAEARRVFCFTQTAQKYADFFLFHTERTECTEILLTEEHKNIFVSRKDAKDAKPYILLFLCLKYSCTQTAQNTQTFYGRTQAMQTAWEFVKTNKELI